tara:strand:- start:248 stop:493 length:246 start_codon:yes stop_codon:yes gene_type:complete
VGDRCTSEEEKMTHGDLDALEDFIDKKEKPLSEAPFTNGSLSVVVPMDDMTQILTQLWKSRQTEPHIGKLYEKYKALIPEE